MEDSDSRHAEERTAQRFVRKPLWQLAGGEAFDEMLLEREKISVGLAFDEHQVGLPKAVIERECDAEERGHRKAGVRPSPSDRALLRTGLLVEGWHAHGRLRGWLVFQRLDTSKSRESKAPPSESAIPTRRNGVSYRNVTTCVPDGTTTARTSALARRMG